MKAQSRYYHQNHDVYQLHPIPLCDRPSKVSHVPTERARSRRCHSEKMKQRKNEISGVKHKGLFVEHVEATFIVLIVLIAGRDLIGI